MRTKAQTDPAGRRDWDLLGGLPAMLDAGLMASRAFAATEGVIAGKQLDEVDQDSLKDTAALLRSAAEVVEFFGSEGKSGSYPNGAFADTVDVTVDALLVDREVITAPAEVSAMVKAVAEAAESFSKSGDKEVARNLSPIFQRLAELLAEQTGHVGETVSRF